MNDDLRKRLKRLQATADAILAVAVAGFLWFGTDHIGDAWAAHGWSHGFGVLAGFVAGLIAAWLIYRGIERSSN